MGKTNSTFVRPLWMASLFALALFLMPALVNAQCQDNVIVTLSGVTDGPDANTAPGTFAPNEECIFVIAPSNIVAGGITYNGQSIGAGQLAIIVNDGTPNRQADGGDGMTWRRDTINGVGTFQYGLLWTNQASGENTNPADDELICWGTVTAEDKTAPEITCPPDYDIECFLVDEVLNNSDSWNWRLDPYRLDSNGDPYYDEDRPYPRGTIFTGYAEGDDCYLQPGFDVSDQVQYFECAETGDGALYTGRISRRFTVRDAGGRTASCTQMINLRRVGVEDFMHVARDLVGNSANDFVNVGTTQSPKWEYTVNTCNADPTANPATVYPRYRGKDEVIPEGKRVPNSFYGSGRASDGNRYDLDDVSCDLSTEVERHQFLNVCSDGSYKEEVSIKVFDWCHGMVDPGSVAFDYVVKVGDFSAPYEPWPGTCITPTNYQNEDDIRDETTGLNGVATTASQLAALEICGMVSTGPMNCTAAMNVSLAALESRFGNLVDDCSDDLSVSVEVYSYLPVLIGKIPTGDSAWVKGDYQRQGDMVMGLPEGLHVLFLNISDRCYNTANFLLYFRVMDLVKPVMKCDDELRVTLVEGDAKLGINGYALATAAEVDEGSWDNCELVDLHVRRSFLNDATGDARADWIAKNDPAGDDLLTDEFGSRNNGDDYTPWRDIVEFFCADVATDGVKVELRGTDRKGNQSICWLDVDVENGTNFEVILSGGNREIDCTAIPANIEDIDEAFMASLGIRADIVSVTSCNTGSAGLLINTGGLNQCGIGTITVSIDPASISELESKNNVVYNPNARRTITVVGDYDYWVKFPADTDYFCEDESAEGVDYETNSCDLITVYEDDERFESVADPAACYKIFRTYKVINWCEYDGESRPVIVSRDWDAHNATNCSINWDNGRGEDPAYTDDAGEYNLNPIEPDGDGVPGNTDMYVIVDINNRNFGPTDRNGNRAIRASEGELDIVYYDNDNDPYNTSTANKYGDTDVNFDNRFNNWGGVYNPNQYRYDEGYWWAVIRGTVTCEGSSNGVVTNTNSGESVWFDDDDIDDNYEATDPVSFGGFDIDGNDADDDTDNRYGSFGYWQYTQHIVVYDDSDPELIVDIDEESLCSIDGEGCDANVEFTATVTDACSTAFFTVTYNVNGGTETAMTDDDGDGTYDATFPDAPLGKHILTVTVTDGCGNVADYTEEFEVVDCKGPAPICHDGIVVELMPTEDGAGMAEVWASDLIASPINDCTALSNDAAGLGEVPVEAYSIFLNEGFVDYATAAADADDQTGLFFTCTDAGTEPMVRVYAEDEAGNVDYCLTFVRVQDNNSICAPAAGGSIAGAVATETAANVEGVEVQLSGARSMMYMTDASGSFGFDGLAQGGDYTVTPQKDLNHLNGVSTFDLVLISKHILGVSQLDSPYKMIAADVNNSQSITTLDLIQLRKLILNIDTEFANNTSWRFIDKSHVFADPSNPWSAPIPEFKNINNLVDNAEAEFVATKIGDVNGSATVEARAATGDFAINTAEQAMIAGNEYTIDFSADMNDIAGYQFTLDVANAEIVDVIYGAAKAENFGVFTKEGVITTSFNGEAAGTLFSVVVRATADTKVSEAIQISSRYTAAEAYTNDAEQLNVNLNVAGATAAEAAFALEQNTPNPFQGETLIGFNLPEAQEATITLQDVAGRTVKMIEGDFTKGYNQVTISANDLPSAGVYFYTLTAGDKSATKKLILVDAVNR